MHHISAASLQQFLNDLAGFPELDALFLLFCKLEVGEEFHVNPLVRVNEICVLRRAGQPLFFSHFVSF